MADEETAAGAAFRRSLDGERLIAVFAALIEPLGRALPSSTEVVLHDLSLLPNSIVAIYGDVTGRRVGDPATDLLLERLSDFDHDHIVGYETTLADGRQVRSSTMIIRDVSGQPVVALCINADLTAWLSIRDLVESMVGGGSATRSQPVVALASEREPGEFFARDVDELASHLIHRAISGAGVPVEQMQKRHKLKVVRDLKARGIFLLRDAVDMVATSLNVTRFTIYNYLNELTEQDAQDQGEPIRPDRKAPPEEN